MHRRSLGIVRIELDDHQLCKVFAESNHCPAPARVSPNRVTHAVVIPRGRDDSVSWNQVRTLARLKAPAVAIEILRPLARQLSWSFRVVEDYPAKAQLCSNGMELRFVVAAPSTARQPPETEAIVLHPDEVV